MLEQFTRYPLYLYLGPMAWPARPSSDEDNDDMVMKVVIICSLANLIEETLDNFFL